MSNMAQSKLVVLWDHEIRLAAGLLSKLSDSLDKKDKTKEEKESEGLLLIDAMNACFAALHGADNKESALVISSVPSIQNKVKAKKAEQP